VILLIGGCNMATTWIIRRRKKIRILMRFFFWLAELAKDRVIKQTSEIAADRHVSARNWTTKIVHPPQQVIPRKIKD
jgi:hypothetical protein